MPSSKRNNATTRLARPLACLLEPFCSHSSALTLSRFGPTFALFFFFFFARAHPISPFSPPLLFFLPRQLVANAFAVLMIARHVEPIWGTREFFKFVALVNVVATALSFLACVLLWLILPKKTVLYGEFSGFTGVTGALTVALKQAMPEERAKIFVVVPVQMKHVPLVFIAVVAVFGLAGGTLVDLPFIVFGVAVGWVYLRFYQERDGVVGDLSEAFSFASFFPDPMQPAMGRVSTFVYATLVRCKCCKPRTTAVDATGNYHHVMEAAGQAPETASGNALIGASDVTEAERRRERALAILAERLAREEAAQTPRGAMNGADMV